jgi:hypothetical protein
VPDVLKEKTLAAAVLPTAARACKGLAAASVTRECVEKFFGFGKRQISCVKESAS